MKFKTASLFVLAALMLSMNVSAHGWHHNSYHSYHHYGYIPAHGYYNNGDRWLGIGIVGAVIAGSLIQSQQPYRPPVVYTTPYDGGYSTPYGYHWIEVPMLCYPTSVDANPYVCGYRNELVPN